MKPKGPTERRQYFIYGDWVVSFDQADETAEVHIIKEKDNGEGTKDVWVPRHVLIKYALDELEPELGSLLVAEIKRRFGFIS